MATRRLEGERSDSPVDRPRRSNASDKLLVVLLAFERMPRPRVTELAAVTDLPKSTVHRLLGDLRARGLVDQGEDGRYQLGYRLWRIARLARPYDTLRRLARPHLEALADQSRESAFLTVCEDLHSVCIDKAEGPQTIRMTLEVGTETPLHLGASNRILLASLPNERARDVMHRLSLERETRDALDADLARIRNDGWAYSTAQLTPGAAAVAVPVPCSKGGPVAGLSIGGPADRFTLQAARQIVPVLRDAAEGIAASLCDVATGSIAPSSPLDRTSQGGHV